MNLLYKLLFICRSNLTCALSHSSRCGLVQIHSFLFGLRLRHILEDIKSSKEQVRLTVKQCVLNLFSGGHHERTVLNNCLIQWLPSNLTIFLSACIWMGYPLNGSDTKTSSVSSTPDRDTPVWLTSEDRTAVLKTGIASPSIVTEPFKASRIASI